MFTFKPAIYDGTSLYELPRPIDSLRVAESWDFEQFKVPLAAGDTFTGHSRNGVDLFIEGRLGTQAGDLMADEEDMFTELESLRDALHVASEADKFDFFIYHDTASATYRHFKTCSTTRFEYDLSDKTLFAFTIAIHADDPTIYTTAP